MTVVKSSFLEQNMLALASRDPELSVALSGTLDDNRYECRPSRNGLAVPWIRQHGQESSVHSTIDPRKEGFRFFQHNAHTGFLIFSGFGGGYHIHPFLDEQEISGIIIVEESLAYLKMLFSALDLTRIILDPRVSWLVEADETTIHNHLLETYIPAVSGDLHYLPLSSRTGKGNPYFDMVRRAIRESVEHLSADYSVQSYFGKRWLKNTIMNIPTASRAVSTIPSVQKAYVIAAGPGLEQHIEKIRNHPASVSLIATDTALPLLQSLGIRPDMVVSIDCQQITYHHFLKGYPKDVPLVLDLASPHFMASLSDRPFFFTSGHPFSQYINKQWRQFPFIDTSGGNVGHAAVSLAARLGAREIHLFGADFSYPLGKSYARGTYLYPYFTSLSSRSMPLEHAFLDFLYRNDTLTRSSEGDGFTYTTRPMLNYRSRLNRLGSDLDSTLYHYQYDGDVLVSPRQVADTCRQRISSPLFGAGTASMDWDELLSQYDAGLAALPEAGYSYPLYRSRLSEEQQFLCLTLFPACAAIRKETNNDSRSYPGARIIHAAASWTRSFIHTFRANYHSYTIDP